MRTIISASRRTDIPAFYAEWFVNRLSEGYAVVKQPYSQKLSAVSLDPTDLGAIVFWSKNYGPLLPKLEQIERSCRNLFFHFTITGNRDLEPLVPDLRDTAADYLFLAKRYSPEQIVWRFDPLCITDKLAYEHYEELFVRAAELLRGAAQRCIISFAHPYKKTVKNLAEFSGQVMPDLANEQKRDLAQRLGRVAEQYGIRLFACCNDYLLSNAVEKAACIDGQYLANLFHEPLDTRLASSRPECACTRSIDIGAYDTCGHGCFYCYATTNHERALQKLRRHDPSWKCLDQPADDVPRPGGQQSIAFP